MTNELGERRDLSDERDSEEYQAMLDTVAEEWAPAYAPFKPDWRAVHAEAARRMMEKYQKDKSPT
jgi:hypothetical protein